jgi:hypothetical protein
MALRRKTALNGLESPSLGIFREVANPPKAANTGAFGAFKKGQLVRTRLTGGGTVIRTLNRGFEVVK